jgi:hypothetical protein
VCVDILNLSLTKEIDALIHIFITILNLLDVILVQCRITMMIATTMVITMMKQYTYLDAA